MHYMTLPAGVVALSAGYQHTCALLTGGGVDCWGWNSNGQLGTSDTTNRYTPTGVTGLGTGGRGGAVVCLYEHKQGGAVVCVGTLNWCMYYMYTLSFYTCISLYLCIFFSNIVCVNFKHMYSFYMRFSLHSWRLNRAEGKNKRILFVQCIICKYTFLNEYVYIVHIYMQGGGRHGLVYTCDKAIYMSIYVWIFRDKCWK